MKAQDLKNSILQMAMEGKLVPQNPNDKPASVLLEKIKEEKEQLIKEKKIKRNNKESFIFRKNNHFFQRIGKNGEDVCIDDELFEIPDTWEWCSLGDLFYCTSGLSYKKNMLSDESEDMVRILRGGNINNEKYEFKENDLFISSEYVKDELYLTKNTLITPAVSSLEQTGKIARIDRDFDDVVAGGFVLRLHPILLDDTFSKFYLNILSSDFHRNNCRSITRKSGQAFYNLSRQKLLNLPIVIPPLEEQKRIVDKLKELLPNIEQYNIFEEKLNKLNVGFPNKLKDSILQDAIQGKLVTQDPNDEPASILLERIKEEKEQLIKAKKIKRNKNESFIFKENNHFYEKIGKNDSICIDEEVPFEIPESWEWCRMENIVTLISGRDMKTSEYNDNEKGIPYITGASNIDDNELIINRWIENPGVLAIQNDILLTCKGTIGKLIILNEEKVHIARQIMAIRVLDDNLIFRQYVLLVLEFYVTKLQNIAKSMIPGITRDDVLKILVPLPPTEEQKRIVDKTNEVLMLNFIKC